MLHANKITIFCDNCWVKIFPANQQSFIIPKFFGIISSEKDNTHIWNENNSKDIFPYSCSICGLQKVKCQLCNKWISKDLSCAEKQIKDIIE